MSEWLKEHAWKSTPPARADAHQIPPTQFRINEFRNINARRRVAVNDAVAPGFPGVSDTVLTQFPIALSAVRVDLRWYLFPCVNNTEQ